ncbi:MAG: hypothetical protein H6659_17140 [Ardenticatenaceae bacterium]|nr:hypothetical protein [Ardenticatenaceae bacterium]MCB8987295.1 hypothetical protein [Ardenticatenaceae bacterium]
MDITHHTPTELTLTYQWPQPWLLLLAILGLVIGFGGGYMLRHFQIGSLLPESWAILLAAMILGTAVTAVFLLFFTVDFSRRHPVACCHLDHKTGLLTVERRVVWRLWLPQRQKFPLDSVTAVSLQDGRYDYTLALHLAGDQTILLAVAPPHVEDNARVARVLAAFMDVPLDLHLGFPDPIRFRPYKEL